MKFILFMIFLNAQTGDISRYETKEMSDVMACVNAASGIYHVEKGIAQVRVCRAVNADGSPVDENKVDDEGKPLDDSSASVPGTERTI